MSSPPPLLLWARPSPALPPPPARQPPPCRVHRGPPYEHTVALPRSILGILFLGCSHPEASPARLDGHKSQKYPGLDHPPPAPAVQSEHPRGAPYTGFPRHNRQHL